MNRESSIVQEMNSIATQFQECIDIIHQSFLAKHSSSAKLIRAHTYINKVFQSFISLMDIEKEILNNEFFQEKEYGWWVGKYNKALYYSLLITSISDFLSKFKEHEK